MEHLCKDFYSPDTLSQDLEGIILEIEHYFCIAFTSIFVHLGVWALLPSSAAFEQIESTAIKNVVFAVWQMQKKHHQISSSDWGPYVMCHTEK